MTTQETFIARIQENGRITIPENTRIILSLKEKDLVRFYIEKVTPTN